MPRLLESRIGDPMTLQVSRPLVWPLVVFGAAWWSPRLRARHPSALPVVQES
jgi:hypothetical protein